MSDKSSPDSAENADVPASVLPKMGRTRRAFINIVFSYANMAVAVFTAFFTTPLIIHSIDTKVYGYWLSTGEIMGYVGNLDLGLLGLFPWLIAEADGKGDITRIRWLMAQARSVTRVMSFAAVLMGGLGALLLISVRGIDSQTQYSIMVPFALIVAFTALNYLLVTGQALLTGMQDVSFIGATTLLKSVLSLLLILLIIYKQGGLFALAIGGGLPPLLINLLLVARANYLYKNLFNEWPQASIKSVKTLLKESIGPWVSGLGVTMIEKSQSVVLTALGHPELSVVYAGTAKLTQVLSIVSVIMVDSTLVGLAQLTGEGKIERKREVVLILLNVQLVVSGLLASLIMAVNPAFVKLWLGNKYFGGIAFNAGLAALILVGGFAYAAIKIVAVQGERLKVGKITLVQGVLHLSLTFVLGWLFGLIGMVMGATFAVGVITLRESLSLLGKQMSLSPLQILAKTVLPWSLNAIPILVLSYIIGAYVNMPYYSYIAAIAGAVSLVYLVAVRKCLAKLPVPERLSYMVRAFTS